MNGKYKSDILMNIGSAMKKFIFSFVDIIYFRPNI